MRLIDADEFERRIKRYDTTDYADKALYNFAHNEMITMPTVDVLDKIRAEIEKVFCMSVVTNELRTPMEVKTRNLTDYRQIQGGHRTKVIIDIPEDILQKINNQYYGENEVDKPLINEALVAILHGTPLNEYTSRLAEKTARAYSRKVLKQIRAEIQHEADNTADIIEMEAYYRCLQIIDRQIQIRE